MAFLYGFDATTVPEDDGYTALPEGKYVAIITSSEVKPTKAGTGEYLSLKFEIIDGKYKGRTVFDNLNIRNPNETAQAIAHRALAQICKAVNVPRPQDSMELHNKPLTISLAVETYQGKEKNTVKAYASATPGGAQPAAAPAGFAQAPAPAQQPWGAQPAPAAAATAAPPWA